MQVRTSNQGDSSTTQAQSVLTNHTYLSIVEHGSKGLLPANSPPSDSVSFGVESRDAGAYYYRTHFYEKGKLSGCIMKRIVLLKRQI